MKKSLLTLLAILTIGCQQQAGSQGGGGSSGKSDGSPFAYAEYESTVEHDTYFDTLLDNFKDLYADYGGGTLPSVKIAFGNTSWRGTRVIGYCEVTNNKSSRLVIINKAFWDGADDITRESLLFHELGHCLLERAHISNRRPASNFWPVSLMNPFILHSDIYGADYYYYQEELFTVRFPQLSFDANVDKTISEGIIEMEETDNGCAAHQH